MGSSYVPSVLLTTQQTYFFIFQEANKAVIVCLKDCEGSRMASRYISHRYGSTSHTSHTSSTSRSRERSVLNDQIGTGMSTQLRDNQAFYSSSSRSSSLPRSSRCGSMARSRSGTLPSRPIGLTVYCPEQPTKSIHERDPLFTDFVASIPRPGTGSLYNSGNLTQLKDQFRVQVQDHWDRRSRGDPAVNHDIAYKTHGWSNYLNRGSTASSEELGRKHSRSQIEANRKSYDSLMPRLTVYHRSTLQ